jgi:dihydropyrimidinase
MSSSADLHVVDARIVVPEIGVLSGSLVVRDGRVVSLGPTPPPARGTEVIDAGGRWVLPGLIDPHVHSGLLPPLDERLESESAFAASGGVTTMIRYVRRLESYLDVLPGQIELGERVQHQDFAHHLVVFNRAQTSDMDAYVRRFGVTSFKVYTNMRRQADVLMDVLAERPNELTAAAVDYDNGHLHEVLARAASLPVRVRVNVHAEDAEIVATETARIRELGLEGLAAWSAARPDIAEAAAIQLVALLARHHRVGVYLPHIGSRAAITAVTEALGAGTDLVAETGPQYVSLTTASPAGVLAKVQPPIRSEADVEAVWDAISRGTLTCMGSDHIAYTRAEKHDDASVWDARPAFGGTGLILPLLLTDGVHAGRIDITTLARVTSMHTARAFGLYPRKGTLLPGADADFVIIDADHAWTVRAGELPSASDFSVHEGRRLTGRAALVASRGRVIARDGQPTGASGTGSYLRRGD